jgi:hypothetical protein
MRCLVKVAMLWKRLKEHPRTLARPSTLALTSVPTLGGPPADNKASSWSAENAIVLFLGIASRISVRISFELSSPRVRSPGTVTSPGAGGKTGKALCCRVAASNNVRARSRRRLRSRFVEASLANRKHSSALARYSSGTAMQRSDSKVLCRKAAFTCVLDAATGSQPLFLMQWCLGTYPQFEGVTRAAPASRRYR